MYRIIHWAALGAVAFALQACDSANNAGGESEATAPVADAQPAAELAPEVKAISLDDVLGGPQRSEANSARDAYRHPKQTLEFFGVRPDSTVIEIWPGGGWYTEILAPYLRDQGRYIAAGFDPESEIPFIRDGVAKYKAMLDADPDMYGEAEMVVLMPPDKVDMVPPGSVDIVLTFRSIHNWMPRNAQGIILESIYAALKPGGVLGVVEHRGNPDIEQDPEAKTGYVNQNYMVAMAEEAGFRFDAATEINANPADTKDHPEGVWTLPPTLRLKEQDQDKYLAIGESDRFTLRFVKPAE